jgi:hypothetical protein
MATIVADKRELVGDDELNDGDRETVRTGRAGKPIWRHLLTDNDSDRETEHKDDLKPD